MPTALRLAQFYHGSTGVTPSVPMVLDASLVRLTGFVNRFPPRARRPRSEGLLAVFKNAKAWHGVHEFEGSTSCGRSPLAIPREMENRATPSRPQVSILGRETCAHTSPVIPNEVEGSSTIRKVIEDTDEDSSTSFGMTIEVCWPFESP
jgi:hypothetical protein